MELYEGSGGLDGTYLRETGLSVIIVTLTASRCLPNSRRVMSSRAIEPTIPQERPSDCRQADSKAS